MSSHRLDSTPAQSGFPDLQPRSPPGRPRASRQLVPNTNSISANLIATQAWPDRAGSSQRSLFTPESNLPPHLKPAIVSQTGIALAKAAKHVPPDAGLFFIVEISEPVILELHEMADRFALTEASLLANSPRHPMGRCLRSHAGLPLQVLLHCSYRIAAFKELGACVRLASVEL